MCQERDLRKQSRNPPQAGFFSPLLTTNPKVHALDVVSAISAISAISVVDGAGEVTGTRGSVVDHAEKRNGDERGGAEDLALGFQTALNRRVHEHAAAERDHDAYARVWTPEARDYTGACRQKRPCRVVGEGACSRSG